MLWSSNTGSADVAEQFMTSRWKRLGLELKKKQGG
jgi:hypothetical protein